MELKLNVVLIDFLYLRTKFIDCAEIGISKNDSNNLQKIKLSMMNKQSFSR